MIKVTSSGPKPFSIASIVETDFHHAEIIALRADGTAESTNPVAQAARIRSYKDYETLKLEHERLQSELEEITATIFDAANQTVRRPMSAETQSERLRVLAKLGRVSDSSNAVKCAHDEEKARLQSELKSAKALLNAALDSADANVASLVQMRNQRDAAQAELAKLHEAATPKSKDDITLVYDQLGPMTEWNPKPSVFVFGMPLEEVRTLKAERDELKQRLSTSQHETKIAIGQKEDHQKHCDSVIEALKRKINSQVGDNATLKAERDQLKHSLSASMQTEAGLRELVHDRDSELAACNERLEKNIAWRCEAVDKRDELVRQLQATKPNIILGCKFVSEPPGGTIRPDDVVTFGNPPKPSPCWCINDNATLKADLFENVLRANITLKQDLDSIGGLVSGAGQETVYQAVRRTILELEASKEKLAAVTRALSG
jgi:chromosome segregation ATPase